MRHQALAFALERSELERQAVDARLRLLQAQVAPYLLFNTLANVQAWSTRDRRRLRRPGCDRHALRAGRCRRLHGRPPGLGQELRKLVRAYLD